MERLGLRHPSSLAAALAAFAALLAASAPAWAQDKTPPATPAADAPADPARESAKEAPVPARRGDPLLWRLEPAAGKAGAKPSWLFGTIHLPDPEVTTLPPAVRRAFDGADEVYTELALEPSLQGEVVPHILDAAPLTERLPKDLYDRTERYLNKHTLSLAAFSRVKVWYMSAQVTVADRLFAMMAKPALDAQLYNDAKKAGKKVGGLETVAEQMNVFDALSAEEQVAVHRTTMDYLEKVAAEGKKPCDIIVAAYLKGDEAALVELLQQSGGGDDPTSKKLEKLLITERNVRMADRIAAMLNDGAGVSRFFAVGALHMPREDGLVKLLGDRGFKVVRVRSAEAPAETPPPPPK